MANKSSRPVFGHGHSTFKQIRDSLWRMVAEKRLLGYPIDEPTSDVVAGAECVTSGINLADLERVFSNLFDNANDALLGLPDPKITVEVKCDHTAVVVYIGDNGRGIPQEVLAKLGTQKVSFGKTKAAIGGSGIGVLGAKERLNRVGGNLTFKSTIGVGTVAIVTLLTIKASDVDAKFTKF